jgi:recombination protein RecT
MTEQTTTITPMGNIKQFFAKDEVQKKFQEMLKENASDYITTLLSIISQNELLQKAEPASIYLSAIQAASMKLPINQNLGFAYIIPYKNKEGKLIAQFQMGYKGYIQLAQRSGQFKDIRACKVYEGQLIDENPLM